MHPPLFYAALHLVCSLTPGVFSKWQAGMVNILFALIGLFFLQKILRDFIRQEWLAGILCLAWVCTLGLYGNIILLRDYTAAMSGSLMVFREALRCLRGHHGYKDWIRLGLSSAFCALSHFYCLIYLFFLCGMLCIILMARKEWKGIPGVFAAELGAAALTLLVFPAVIGRVFGSRRGSQAATTLNHFSFAEYKHTAHEYFNLLNRNFFGNLIPWALALLILFIVIWIFRKRSGASEPKHDAVLQVNGWETAFTVIPALCYCAMITQISPMIKLRYMYPVAAILFLSLIVSLSYIGGKVLSSKGLSFVLAGCVALAAGLSWPYGTIDYMYSGLNARIAAALSPYDQTDAVLVQTKTNSNPNVILPQLDYYQSLTIISGLDPESPTPVKAMDEGKNIILLLRNTSYRDTYLQNLMLMYPEYSVEKLGKLDGQNRFTNYYCHKD